MGLKCHWAAVSATLLRHHVVSRCTRVGYVHTVL